MQRLSISKDIQERNICLSQTKGIFSISQPPTVNLISWFKSWLIEVGYKDPIVIGGSGTEGMSIYELDSDRTPRVSSTDKDHQRG